VQIIKKANEKLHKKYPQKSAFVDTNCEWWF